MYQVTSLRTSLKIINLLQFNKLIRSCFLVVCEVGDGREGKRCLCNVGEI